jgi:predicted transcriptional regulator
MVPTVQPDQEPVAVSEGAFAVPQAHRSAVLEGFDEAERGEFARDEEMEALWTRCGL